MNDGGSVHSINKLCRICLNVLQDHLNYDLFTIPGLAKKLCVCTSLSVEPQDGFPPNLCTHCYDRLNDLHEFQKMCVDSVQKFQDMIAKNYFTPVINPDINQIDDVELDEDRNSFDPLLSTKIEIIENEEDVFKMLEDVDKETEDIEQAKDYSAESDEEGDNDDDFQINDSDSEDNFALSCLKIGTRSTTAKSKKSSATKANDDSESSNSETDSNNDDSEEQSSRAKPKRKRIPAAERDRHKLIECHICQAKFKRALRYEEHMKHHNDLLPFQCTVETCKKGFTTPSGLRLHMDHSHPELCPIIPCTFPGCDKTFPKTILLTVHMRKAHNVAKPIIRRHACSECDKVFTCPTALKRHMYKHTGEELPFACEICGKRFPIYTVLRDHLLRHAGIKNHVCPYCGVGKTTRQEWNKHILTHTKEKQYQCTQCDHASHNKQALTKHIRVVHMKIKNHGCQYCGKIFGTRYACNIHERLHTGENCPECKICGKKFVHEKSLTKHLQSHEKGEIPLIKNPTSKAKEHEEQMKSVTPVDIKPLPSKPSRSRVEVVDISQLAGLTEVNPIPTVSVPDWTQGNVTDFPKKDGQHICPGCGRGFNHLANMKIHLKAVHQKIKDFACRFCPKRFARAQYLRSHESIHSGEKPCECKICGRHFRQDQFLKAHIMRVHSSPQKPPKEKKPKKPPSSKPREPKIELNKEPPKIHAEYQDPAAERAAATAALQAQQIEEGEAKRRQEENNRKIQEAAYEQLNRLQKQIQSEKGSYDSYYEQKADAEGLNPNALKLDHV